MVHSIKRINDLPRFLLPSSKSATSFPTPTLDFLPPFWTTCLPDHSVTIYLFFHSYLQAKGLVEAPACTQLPTHIFLCCDGGTKAPSAGLEMGILTILCAQGCCGWCSLGTCRAAAAPAAWHRLETRDYTSTSRESLNSSLSGWSWW